MNLENDIKWMKKALELAKVSLNYNVTPIGCVIVSNNEMISYSSKTYNFLGNSVGHSEIVAISNAKEKLKVAKHYL